MSRRQFDTTTETIRSSTPAQRVDAPEAQSTHVADRDPLAFVAPRPRTQAVALSQASGGRLARAGDALLHLQRGYGNRYVQRVVNHTRPATAPVIQPKLVLGPADDSYEREADRVAQQVAGQIGGQGRAVQRQRDEDEDEELLMRTPDIQRVSSAAGGAVDAGVQQGIQQARGGGQPLPDHVRGSMEQAFGADFSRVRIHTDAQSDMLNRSIQARAFTTGQDVFLRREAYAPGSRAGQELLAHELTHVEQQNMESRITSTEGVEHTIQRQWAEMEDALKKEDASSAFYLVEHATKENLNEKDARDNNVLHLLVQKICDPLVQNKRNFVDTAVHLIGRKKDLLQEENQAKQKPLDILFGDDGQRRMAPAEYELLYYIETSYHSVWKEQEMDARVKGNPKRKGIYADIEKQEEWEKEQRVRSTEAVKQNYNEAEIEKIWNSHIISKTHDQKLIAEIVKEVEMVYNKSKIMHPIIETATLAMLGMHERASKFTRSQDLQIILTTEDEEKGMPMYQPGGDFKAVTIGTRIYLRMPQQGDESVIRKGVSVLLHEVTHYVANEVYKNDFQPYSTDIQGKETGYLKIVEDTGKLAEKWSNMSENTPEGIVREVYDTEKYRGEEQNRELIVRVSEIIGQLGWQKGTAWLEENTPSLYKFFMGNFSPRVEGHNKRIREKFKQ